MAKIQPVQIWNNGQNKEASIFNLVIIADDLKSSASFYYQLAEETISSLDDQGMVVGEVLTAGNLSISGDEYENWNGSNVDAYTMAAEKLQLTIID